LAEPGEAGIAFGMAVGAVEQIEVIEIDHQQRQFAVILLGLHPFEVERLCKPRRLARPESMSIDANTVRRSLVATSSRWPRRAAIALKAWANDTNSAGSDFSAARADQHENGRRSRAADRRCGSRG